MSKKNTKLNNRINLGIGVSILALVFSVSSLFSLNTITVDLHNRSF